MTERKGNIKVQTSDIFPIIKKWLYSEHDIFVRELVSNATDAITKRATLGRNKNTEIPEGKISVAINKTLKTITITDNGLGMTEEEVEKYIAQLAFSGAEEFVQKMKSEGEKGSDIIGKFGLGFYSSFMVAAKVEVDSLSMNEGAKPIKWICEGDTDYVFAESTRSEVGTQITLHINSESEEFLDEWKLGDILHRYCDFMPYEISIIDVERKEKPRKDDGSVDESAPEVAVKPRVINDTVPLWKQDPTTLKDEDYKTFFKKLFPMDPEPLFWLHLKVDHPFTLDGILYFPKINPKMPFQEKNIRLYSKQVFVSDNVKNIIPEFLSLLKGVVDSSDIPLNVSRSSLQGDPNVTKISNYIVRKVAEALKKLFRNDRPKFEQIWEDTGLFVKYGCVSDTKFDELMREMIVFKNSENKLVTLPEYKESIPEKFKEKLKDKIVYFEKDKSDPSLRSELLEAGIQALTVDEYIDPHFMQHAEYKKVGDQNYQFVSIDSEMSNLFEAEATNEDDIKVKDLFQEVLVGAPKSTEESTPADLGKIDIEIQKIKNTGTPAYFKVDEQMKRFAKMAQNMGQNNPFPIKRTLVINPGNPLIINALKLNQSEKNRPLVEKIVHHVEDLANISSEGLKSEDREMFVKRTQDLIQELTGQLL
ncbi:MAG: molecular chaperone HtpG [Bdellovibrio sp. CG12_big_fil_rev_8_21_14_0_65_39_13]|nr:MAG: molecular chaperone HtpG [Bdellovibrio sp. CG22_combo_CG10-13_8_21_14_all_39_27]PIQ58273.1 MAG: molecular chaperone HtpG [Bdellovibrio sp. CG12_big_fil_rev_8_21_14_0_65_39_13]PIR36682.1 MAG: molecular chaperone HtpG [Bdellovibrio sp. CG11_big_fil_rev_8_21_14_0_20_39_38]